MIFGRFFALPGDDAPTRASKLLTLACVRRVQTVLALAAITIFPLVHLLRFNAHFNGDFDVSYWMTGYEGQYFRLYHHPPNVFQTSTSLGIAFPVLYGVLFYRLTGLLSALTDTDIALRLLLFAVVAAEVCVTYRAARALGGGRKIAILFCVGAALSTYGLTDLYNRGDEPEFVAIVLLTTSLAGWFWSVAAESSTERWLARSVIAACLTLLGGTHAISTIISGATLAYVVLLTLCFDRRRPVLVTAAVAGGAYLCGAAILCVDYLTLAHRIHLDPGIYQYGFAMFPDRIDAVGARFSLFPFDPQTLLQGKVDVSTPYLEATVDYALALFAVAVLTLRRDAFATALLAAGAIVGVISVWPWFWSVSPPAIHFLQYPYRLTAYVDILFFCAALAVLLRLPRESRRIGKTPLPWIAGTLAVLACSVKLSHAFVMYESPNAEVPATYTDVGPFVMHTNYITTPIGGDVAPRHPPPPLVGMRTLGDPLPQRYTADRHGYVFTRILVLPWNRIVVDGQPLSESVARSWKNDVYYAFQTQPGSAHVVTTWFDLPTIVDRVIRFAEYVFLIELGAVVAAIVAFARAAPGRRRLLSTPSYRVRARMH